MLTDEERERIWNDLYPDGDRLSCKLDAFAIAIERAVLAKAMPIPKQEPDYWKIGGLGGDVITNKKSELDLAERFNWPVEPLYKHPQPSQAAAIPNGVITGVLSSILLCRREPMAPHNVAALREHLGERTDEELTFYIQNGRWPISASPKPDEKSPE